MLRLRPALRQLRPQAAGSRAWFGGHAANSAGENAHTGYGGAFPKIRNSGLPLYNESREMLTVQTLENFKDNAEEVDQAAVAEGMEALIANIGELKTLQETNGSEWKSKFSDDYADLFTPEAIESTTTALRKAAADYKAGRPDISVDKDDLEALEANEDIKESYEGLFVPTGTSNDAKQRLAGTDSNAVAVEEPLEKGMKKIDHVATAGDKAELKVLEDKLGKAGAQRYLRSAAKIMFGRQDHFVELDSEGFAQQRTNTTNQSKSEKNLSDDPFSWERPEDIPVHANSDQNVTIVKMNGEPIYIPQISRTLEWSLSTPTELHCFLESPVIYEATTEPERHYPDVGAH